MANIKQPRKNRLTRIFAGKLAGTPVFDPIGDQVGRVADIVLLLRFRGAPRAVGVVVEVGKQRRVFLPFSRITSIEAGAVIMTGRLDIRRFQQRNAESLAIADLLDRLVDFKDGSGQGMISDIALQMTPQRDWLVDQYFVERVRSATLGYRRTGESVLVHPGEVTGTATAGMPQDASSLLETLDKLKPADLADALHDLSDQRMIEVAQQLPDDRLADVLEELSDDDRVLIVNALEANRAADVLDEMQPDDAADLVSELPQAKADELLELMEPEEAEDVRRLMSYEEHTAGGLMTTEPIILPPDATVAMLLANVRREDIPAALAAIVFVTRPPLETPTGKYLGVVHLQRALREPPQTLIGTILDTDIEPVEPEVSIGTVTRLMATYNLVAFPVVDPDGKLLGAVSVDDVLDHLMPDDWRDADEEITDRTIERNAAHG
ncbi:magnesium transporter [Boudabousia liubingyangii]|uniref:Magnesium transporter n=1 Tax=Boudabousia liubingyangii TaxID=1921764 RepID=A0A1Q5PQD9_9ACTO|nr:CBS domain-containing protein [Boudabousia liubingyangii]OKL48194.1 magnesium transporter [Boudabousia liubingyangii]OKL49777.1 magnesium transporter [Boudabousia liubingyangii]